jgi:hypothetical protein
MRLPGAFTNEQSAWLKELFEEENLGPVEVYFVPATDVPDGVLVVEMAPSPTTGQRLLEWFERLERVVDTNAGTRGGGDPMHYLTVRGVSPEGFTLVIGTYDEREQPEAVALMYEVIEQQNLPDLLGRLAALDPVAAG